MNELHFIAVDKEKFNKELVACKMALGCVTDEIDGLVFIYTFNTMDAEIIIDTLEHGTCNFNERLG